MALTLSVIIVNWNVRELLRRAIHSVYQSWDDCPGLEIIVVDNASSDDSVAMVKDTYPAVRIIANSSNLGFTAANNQGLAIAQGDFILLLNPDTEVVGVALPALIDYAKRNPRDGMIGPQLLNPDGTVQPSRRRFPTLPVLFLESTWLEPLLPARDRRRFFAETQPDHLIQAVDWITGAAMLTRREVIAEVGGMDEQFFMYSEELDWCRRIKAAGWEIRYLPEAKIIHHEGKSSEQVAAARHIYFQSSKVLYTRKYHGALIATLLRWWLLSQYCWQIGVEGAKWLVGHRRPLRGARIAAYRDVLSSHLRHSGPWNHAAS